MVPNYVAIALYRFLKEVVREHKKRLSVDYPPSSKPGQSPRRRTGNLSRSLGFTPGKASQMVTNAGQAKLAYFERAFYGNILEIKLGRTPLSKTVEDMLARRSPNSRVRIRHRSRPSYETLPS